MPIYEYQCNSCGKKFEKIEKFSDPPLTTHEECGGPVERLLSAPALQFKGTGWYVTDYARSNGGAASPKNGSESKTESKAESKTESSNTKSDSNGSSSTSTTSSTPAPSNSK